MTNQFDQLLADFSDQQAGRRERARFFDRRSKAGIDLAASAVTLGRQSHVRRCPADDQRRSGLVSFYDHKTSQGGSVEGTFYTWDLLDDPRYKNHLARVHAACYP
jgi:hypothetical protein